MRRLIEVLMIIMGGLQIATGSKHDKHDDKIKPVSELENGKKFPLLCVLSAHSLVHLKISNHALGSMWYCGERQYVGINLV